MFSKAFRTLGLVLGLAAVCTPTLAADNYYLKPAAPTDSGATQFRAKDTNGSGLLMVLHGLAGPNGVQYDDSNGLPVRLMNPTTGGATATAQATGNSSLSSIAAANGSPTDSAWDGAASSAAQVGILKALWLKLTGLLTVDTVVRSTSADRGGTLAAGNTSQQFMGANPTRRGFIVQNQSSGDLFINCLTAAAQNQTSLRIPAGILYATDPHHSGTAACNIIGATTGQAYYAREF